MSFKNITILRYSPANSPQTVLPRRHSGMVVAALPKPIALSLLWKEGEGAVAEGPSNLKDEKLVKWYDYGSKWDDYHHYSKNLLDNIPIYENSRSSFYLRNHKFGWDVHQYVSIPFLLADMTGQNFLDPRIITHHHLFCRWYLLYAPRSKYIMNCRRLPQDRSIWSFQTILGKIFSQSPKWKRKWVYICMSQNLNPINPNK